MYEAFYGFREKPFNLTPDPKFLYMSDRHREAVAHLAFGHQERGGFIVITGEVGTGKTTVARSFLSRLGPETASAVVLYPALTAAELLRTILDDLHVPAASDSLKDLVDALRLFLLEARRGGRTVVLLIDEAQDLSAEVLEQIRLLSNLETDTEKLIQIVLMGQSELNELLARRVLRQLAQRVTARYHLTALSRGETARYVRHRLEVAGGAGGVGFTARALKRVYRDSGGLPRLINLVCDRALLAGYVRGVRTIDDDLVRLAVREVMPPGPWRLPRAAAAPLLFGGAAAIGIGALWLAGLSGAPAQAIATGRAPLPSPAAAPLKAGAGATHIGELLFSLPQDTSLDGAIRQIQGIWRETRLERIALRGADVAQLRRLDLPTVLEMLHPARREPCYVALLGLSADRASIAAGGTLLSVPWADVEALWTRQAVVLFKDFDAALSPSDSKRLPEWAWQRLTSLGYPGSGTQDLAPVVAEFQREHGLLPDGVLGKRTVLALYSRGPHQRPRLRGPS